MATSPFKVNTSTNCIRQFGTSWPLLKKFMGESENQHYSLENPKFFSGILLPVFRENPTFFMSFLHFLAQFGTEHYPAGWYFLIECRPHSKQCKQLKAWARWVWKNQERSSNCSTARNLVFFHWQQNHYLAFQVFESMLIHVVNPIIKLLFCEYIYKPCISTLGMVY